MTLVLDHEMVHSWVARTCTGLADLLEARPDAWQAQTLCERWLVRHLVAHVTMPVRLTPERFGAEMAAAGGDFGVLSDTVALRDGDLPAEDLLGQLRSPDLHAWQPPGGGEVGALSHAVIHALDVTVPLGVAPVSPDEAMTALLEHLVASDGAWFGVDPAGALLEPAEPGPSIALLSGRTLPDGRVLARR